MSCASCACKLQGGLYGCVSVFGCVVKRRLECVTWTTETEFCAYGGDGVHVVESIESALELDVAGHSVADALGT